MYLIIFAILLISLIIALYAQNNNPKKSNLKSSYIKKKGVFFERTLSINHFRGFESMFLHVQTDDGLIYKSERLYFLHSRKWLKNREFFIYINKNNHNDFYIDTKINSLESKSKLFKFSGNDKSNKQEVKARGLGIEAKGKNQKMDISRYYFLYVQEMSQPYRIFKSDKVEMLPNIEWFEDYEFKVYLNPNDATDFFIDYKKRSILSRFNGLRNALKNNKHTIREYQEYNPSKDLL